MTSLKSDSGTTFIAIGMIAAWVLLVLSCSNPLNSSKEDLGGPGIVIPGESVDGVKLGDTRDRVEEILGPHSNIGWGDGITRGWRIYQYKPPGSEGLGLTISFIYQGEDKSWGPVDKLTAHKPYEGKTPDGIGIGSTLGEVRKAYGEPDYIPSDIIVDGTHRLQYTYCYDSIKFTIGMDDQVVIGFFIGHFIPIEQDQTYQCK